MVLGDTSAKLLGQCPLRSEISRYDKKADMPGAVNLLSEVPFQTPLPGATPGDHRAG